jgi:hypothetical protein
VPEISLAEHLDCGVVTIEQVYVQASREDNSHHQNSVLVILGNDKQAVCEDVTFAQVKNTDAAYDGILAIALAAYMSNTKLRVVVNANGYSGTYPIEWVNLN